MLLHTHINFKKSHTNMAPGDYKSCKACWVLYLWHIIYYNNLWSKSSWRRLTGQIVDIRENSLSLFEIREVVGVPLWIKVLPLFQSFEKLMRPGPFSRNWIFEGGRVNCSNKWPCYHVLCFVVITCCNRYNSFAHIKLKYFNFGL